MKDPTKLTMPIHFEDSGWKQFERLVFAYFLRTYKWISLEWYGQTGSDLGRDIWGILEDDHYGQISICNQCANRKSLEASKAIKDIDKILSAPSGKPDRLYFVCGGDVSAFVRDSIKSAANQQGISTCIIWSGSEFEENVRVHCEPVLRRFVNGEEFPDSPDEIDRFVTTVCIDSDEDALALMARLFDRPAFYTPFHKESSLPAFKKAITDTIEALNTGFYRLRDGTLIRQIPNRHDLQSSEVKNVLSQIVRDLVQLRSKYDQFIHDGKIQRCDCTDPNCPMHILSHTAAHEMDRLRFDILSAFRRIYPKLDIQTNFQC